MTGGRDVLQSGDSDELVCELRVHARPSRLRLIRRVVGEAVREMDCSPGVVEGLVSAVDEACQNIIRYAYKGDPEGVILLRIERAGDNAVIRLIDYAEPVDPAGIQPRPLNELRPGGLGTHLIHAAADSVEFEPPAQGTGNVLKLVKRIE
jgi:sigma-B regulation protein RsbU (phosphoserine phosphatase)